ncbi:hypothetical protein BP6252_11123 [Coleophoma cylindrospora]|uniref:DUF4215 domain-containing protein n=1 Tax=Coleophoma cylindrospora TaxID=1849047 RepID=A0A3D8QPH1_9HELO|nr:hypothetical protein BP6252_11123 [Coleophoma cylindrospora]
MKISTAGIFAGLLGVIYAEDYLFIDTLLYDEYDSVVNQLNQTAKVVNETEWRAMTTADFAQYKALVISDPDGTDDPTLYAFLDDTKDVWGPAVTGNIILIGTDPSNHENLGVDGAGVLIDNAVSFAAAGEDLTGKSITGLYFALSHLYDTIDNDTVLYLSYFGDFGVHGNLGCYDTAHIVASSPALGTLSDADLSNWGCSVHEAFTRYPTVGINSFQALAIAQDVPGDGSRSFGDGTAGVPYIISRGATPSGCGDGHFDPALGEECDDGNLLNGDGCSLSCKCESGRSDGNGNCLPRIESTTSLNSTSTIPISTPFANSTTGPNTFTVPFENLTTANPSLTLPFNNFTTATTALTAAPTSNSSTSMTITFASQLPTTTTIIASSSSPPPNVYPIIIGVEIIIYIDIIEFCAIKGRHTVTSYITSACSTETIPIYNTPLPGYPCYICEMDSRGLTFSLGIFVTATTSYYASIPTSYTPHLIKPTIKMCPTCKHIVIPTDVPYS